MGKKFGIFILLFLSTFHGEMIFRSGTSSWAEISSKLLEMNGFENNGMTRIHFDFDRIPKFDVENSGQRIRIYFSRTLIEPSFNKVNHFEKIIKVKTHTKADQSVLDLYFRNLPKFVDFTLDQERDRLLANVFWRRDDMRSRPAIMDRKLGEYMALERGVVAQKFVSSKYRGRWIDFFEEFESPVQLSIPIGFSFPPLPFLFPEKNAKAPNEKPVQAKTEALREYGARKIEFSNDDSRHGSSPVDDLTLAESLIRQKKYKEALEILDHAEVNPEDSTKNLWKEYFRSYAKASSGNYYQSSELPGHAENFLKADAAAPWYRVFQVELALARKKSETALDLLESEGGFGESFAGIFDLRKADALFQAGLHDRACVLYQNAAADLDFFRRHPHSLANWAELLYAQKDFATAAKYYSLLSETLKDRYPEQKPLADYRSAEALLRANDTVRARLLFSSINDENPGTVAGLRSWLKLIDLDILADSAPPLLRLISEYDEIVELASSRTIREEAFFKKILACHISGENLKAVKFLGRFFDEYWAGPLMPEAQALLVEVFPKLVESLIRQDESFLALALVAKHRELLAQACITYDFLHSLAEHYYNAGFLEQAKKTYFFMLDFEKEKTKRNAVYLPLIRIFYQQKKYEQCVKYSEIYLNENAEEKDRARILYYYADALCKKGEIARAAKVLLEKKRPATKALDKLAGELFFDLGQYDLVEYYLSRAQGGETNDPGLILKRAEALYHSGKWREAIPLYESLMENSRFGGQAGYRLIRIFAGMGENQRALNLFNKMTEKEIDKHWIDLSDYIVRTGNHFQAGR